MRSIFETLAHTHTHTHTSPYPFRRAGTTGGRWTGGWARRRLVILGV